MKIAIRLALAFGFVFFLESFIVPTDQDDLVRTNSFAVKKGGLLDLLINAGEVHVIPWEKSEVFVKVRGLDEEEFDRLEMTSNGNTVKIRGESDRWSGDTRVEVSVPSSFRVDVKTGCGNIEVKGPLSGIVNATTSAGDVLVGDIRGTIRVRTAGGNIQIGNVEGDIELRTAGGDILVGTVSGTAEISTSGGNIQIESVKRSLQAKSSGGDVRVGDVGVGAEIATLGGNVVLGKIGGGATLTTAGGDIDLQSAHGVVTTSTGGGNIRLADVAGSILATTGAGDVDAELIPTDHGSTMIVTGNGVIRLSVPEDAKATIEARIHVDDAWDYDRESFHIRSQFPSKDYQKYHDKKEIRATYILNNGGQRIKLETANADIEIRKLVSRSR
ncbi:MAG: hypothetical protein HYR76_11935 [Ignavibacteria bacterium]|nr:hypothetical protein [Ignavibacteria bacterium]MBI3765156.1 hypothetical protein [Ignavibacteriales bacterium]